MSRFMPEAWPIPGVSDVNREFFTSGEVKVQKCNACGAVQHPPEELCHKCHEMDLGWETTSGTGTIYSFIVVHHPPAPILADTVPYAVVLVALDDQPHVRLLGNVLNRPASELEIGQKVRAVFEEIEDAETNETIRMPQWEVV